MLYVGAVAASALLLAPTGGAHPVPLPSPEPPASCVVPVHAGLLTCPPDGRRQRELPQSCVVPVAGGHRVPRGRPLVACPEPPLFPKGRTVPLAPSLGPAQSLSEE